MLKPSEVGSIPTHSRHPYPAVSRGFAAGVAALLAAVFLGGGGAAAQEGAGAPEPEPGEPIEITPELFETLPVTPVPDPGPTEPGALERAFRSALFPAWGQLTNDRPRKAVVIFAVQTYIYSRVVLETRKAREAQRRADRFAAGDQADPDVVFAMEAAETSAQEHFDRRRDMLFWAVVGGFYGAMDAYIDAHLGHFERDLDEDRTLFGDVDPVRGEATLGLRF
ncbi:MAG: hypothetical protein K8H89_00235 [Flavobacteriales bacterium]|nr:hypothetical protein [Flavobacteriales bacterium]